MSGRARIGSKSRGDQGRGGAWIWIGVEDAQKLHEELKARGVTIREGPTNDPWALEFRVEIQMKT